MTVYSEQYNQWLRLLVQSSFKRAEVISGLAFVGKYRVRKVRSIVLKENSGSHRKDMKIKVSSHILCFYTMCIISLLLFFIRQLINMLSLYRYTTIK